MPLSESTSVVQTIMLVTWTFVTSIANRKVCKFAFEAALLIIAGLGLLFADSLSERAHRNSIIVNTSTFYNFTTGPRLEDFPVWPYLLAVVLGLTFPISSFL